MVQDGTMEAGDLFSFIIYTGILGGAIASFGTLYTQIVGAIGATERIQEILATPSELSISKTNKSSELKIKGEVTYEDVRFSYPSRKDMEILKGINIKIQPGQKLL